MFVSDIEVLSYLGVLLAWETFTVMCLRFFWSSQWCCSGLFSSPFSTLKMILNTENDWHCNSVLYHALRCEDCLQVTTATKINEKYKILKPSTKGRRHKAWNIQYTIIHFAATRDKNQLRINSGSHGEMMYIVIVTCCISQKPVKSFVVLFYRHTFPQIWRDRLTSSCSLAQFCGETLE